jgi:hypothetical protein
MYLPTKLRMVLVLRVPTLALDIVCSGATLAGSYGRNAGQKHFRVISTVRNFKKEHFHVVFATHALQPAVKKHADTNRSSTSVIAV